MFGHVFTFVQIVKMDAPVSTEWAKSLTPNMETIRRIVRQIKEGTCSDLVLARTIQTMQWFGTTDPEINAMLVLAGWNPAK